MKKVLVLFAAIAVFAVAKTQAQNVLVPADCQNFGLLVGKVQGQLAQGWEAISFQESTIAYKIQPEPPYLSGSLTITYVPVCEPLEPCPEIAKIDRVDIWIIQDNGTCQYRDPGN